ncbi:MAG: hypothetical protein SFW09_20865 [Hyphomicrobiaceae bacterium]|nr:hypothetical protein [Hyphomicrobiaceae bacterium]
MSMLPAPVTLALIIVTVNQNQAGQQRIYLGGKSSLEAWIEPKADKTGWTFHLDEAVTGNRISDDDRRIWAVHILLELARALDVSPNNLAAVPYEAITALHAADPFEGRRIAGPKRRVNEHGFMSTRPDIRRPASDFKSGGPAAQARSR